MPYVNFLSTDNDCGNPASSIMYTEGFGATHITAGSLSFQGTTGTSSAGNFTVSRAYKNIYRWRASYLLVELDYYFKFGAREYNNFLLLGNGYVLFGGIELLTSFADYLEQNAGQSDYSAESFSNTAGTAYNIKNNEYALFAPTLSSITLSQYDNYDSPYPYYVELAEYTGVKRKLKLRWIGQNGGYNTNFPTPYQYNNAPNDGEYSSDANLVVTYEFSENDAVKLSLDQNEYGTANNSSVYYLTGRPLGYFNNDFTAIESGEIYKNKNSGVQNTSFLDSSEYTYSQNYSSVPANRVWTFSGTPIQELLETIEHTKVEVYGFGKNSAWSELSVGGAAYNIFPYDKTNTKKFATAPLSDLTEREVTGNYILDIDMSSYTSNKPLVISIPELPNLVTGQGSSNIRFNFKNLDLPKHSGIVVKCIVKYNGGNLRVYLPYINGYNPLIPDSSTYDGMTNQYSSAYVSISSSVLNYTRLLEFYIENVGGIEITDYYNVSYKFPDDNSYKVSFFAPDYVIV
jgi:hypothetical protein